MEGPEVVVKNGLSRGQTLSAISLVSRKSFKGRTWSTIETVLFVLVVLFFLGCLAFAILFGMKVSECRKDNAGKRGECKCTPCCCVLFLVLPVPRT